ncbi:hypothetical protein JTB14_032746 [Gonioctena quinquepunctata]|nr:hypothetical protein JTB14_032746 [Gonioctena quinquepunctata]
MLQKEVSIQSTKCALPIVRLELQEDGRRHLDICGIHSKVIFKINNNDNKDRRKVFFLNIALQLMEDHSKDRAQMKSLPKDVFVFLSQFREDKQHTEELTGPGICHICGSHENNRTKLVCQQ